MFKKIKILYSSSNKIEKFIFILIVIITASKLLLINKGFLAFPDEARYYACTNVLKSIQNLNLNDVILNIYNTQGRPGEVIIRLIPAFFQYISAQLLGLNLLEPNNSYVVFLFNFLINSLLLLLHYKFSMLLLKNKTASLLSVLLFSVLVISFVHIRHVLPYDLSLLVFYFVLYKILKNSSKEFTIKQSIILGILSFFAFSIYPGYIILLATSGLFFSIIIWNNFSLSKSIKSSFYYLLGSILLLLLTEFFSRLIGKSYIGDSLILSKTITQGSFNECYVFIFKYFLEVEKITGILLLIGLLLFLIAIINNRKTVNSSIIILFFTLTFFYLFYATMGFYMHKVVFYGRLLFQFMPFICVFCIYGFINVYKNQNKVIIYLISIVLLISYVINFKEYLKYDYPNDVVWNFCKKSNNYNIIEVSEYQNSFSDLDYFRSKNVNLNKKKRVTIVNSCHFSPLMDLKLYKKFIPNPNLKQLEIYNYYENYIGYQFEGLNSTERKNIDKMNFKIKIYQ